MKLIAINIILIILVLLFIAVAFFGIMLMGSVHRIPKETTNKVLLLLLVLGALIGLFTYFRRIVKR